MSVDSLELHNVEATVPVEDSDGQGLRRVPTEVHAALSEGAQERMDAAAGVELRFVPGSEPVTLTLSASADARCFQYWGEFLHAEPELLSSEPQPVEFELPPGLDRVSEPVQETAAFDPAVCRLCFDSEPVQVHSVDGPARKPSSEELPDTTLLAYGTSITEGVASTGPHLTYPAQAARRLGIDHLNLGSAGTAYCEPELADHIAARDDWDVATLALSVNMVGEFALETFEQRVSYMVETIASENPEKPVFAITLYPFHPDVLAELDPDTAAADAERFRTVLRDAVATAGCSNLQLLEGPDLLDPHGLSTDLIHPADTGMTQIGERLARELESVV